MAHTVLTLDDLNVGSLTIKDRDGETRFVVSVSNVMGTRLELHVNAWDKGNYGTPNDSSGADVIVSHNQHIEDAESHYESRASRKES